MRAELSYGAAGDNTTGNLRRSGRAAAEGRHSRVAPHTPRRYMRFMSLFLNRLARYAARRIASDPKARDTAVNVARTAVAEAKGIVGDEDPARAAGRAVRRAFNKWQGQEPQDVTPPERLERPRDS
ncbi:MAG TPA: hypothetical protein VHG92_14435 [Afifellaceae bacterium]|nr:hypothetical protein [Afifellaceae bacterium]